MGGLGFWESLGGVRAPPRVQGAPTAPGHRNNETSHWSSEARRSATPRLAPCFSQCRRYDGQTRTLRAACATENPAASRAVVAAVGRELVRRRGVLAVAFSGFIEQRNRGLFLLMPHPLAEPFVAMEVRICSQGRRFRLGHRAARTTLLACGIRGIVTRGKTRHKGVLRSACAA